MSKETATAILTQVKTALRALEGGKEQDIHPADQLFAEMLLAHPLKPAVQLSLAAKVLRSYHALLYTQGVEVPLLQAMEEATQFFLYEGLAPVEDDPADIPEKQRSHVIYIGNQRVMVEFPYDPQKQIALTPLKETIEDWAFNRFSRKEWSYPLHAITEVEEALSPYSFTYSPQAQLQLQHVQRESSYQLELEKCERYWKAFEQQEAQRQIGAILHHPRLADGRTLYHHQQEAIERIVNQGRLVLAHDMGLGKTLSSLLAAQAYRRPVFVIAPVSVHIPWLREAESLHLAIELYSWARIPPVPEQEFVLIGDEAHMIQSLQSQRTKAFLALAERASAVICATGTPMKNAQATNLYPLLVACQHPLGQDKRGYERRYCAGYVRKIGKRSVYEATGTMNRDELHEKTRDVILFKKKQECLDLPPKIRIARPVEETPEIDTLYEETSTRLWAEHEARMQAKKDAAQAMIAAAQEYGTDVDPAVLEAAGGADTSFARALVEMEILRHAASVAKVTEAIAVAEEIQEQGGSIVIFSIYRDTARQLSTLLQADCLTGETSAKERQVMIDRFQARQSAVLICTSAGGLGITLTAAQTVILVERPWTPGDAVQSEDRLHRIGQVGTVHSIWLQYGPMDDRVDRLLEQKQLVIDHVLTGTNQGSNDMSRSVLSSAREILKSIQENIPLDQLLSKREQELIAQAEAAANKARQGQPVLAEKRTKEEAEEKKLQVKRPRAGRPRKGGDTSGLRQGFEITLDEQTLQRLKARTSNRSAYIERLILEEDEEHNLALTAQIQAKFTQRCEHFPPAVASTLQQIGEKRGIQAALEASEAVALVLDPGRTIIP